MDGPGATVSHTLRSQWVSCDGCSGEVTSEEPTCLPTMGPRPARSQEDRQQVTVWLRLDDPNFETEREQIRVFAFEDRLMRALEAGDVGEHDTNDLETGLLRDPAPW